MRKIALLLVFTCLLGGAFASPALAAFEVQSFDGSVDNADGTSDTQAGAHPYSATTTITFSSHKEGFFTFAEGSPKDLHVELPQGFVGNPTAVPTCTEKLLEEGGCPDETQVGTVHVRFGGVSSLGEGITYPIWNIEAAPGTPGAFGAKILGGTVVHLIPQVHTRPNGEYSLTVDSDETSQTVEITSIEVTFWGVPADEGHDAERGGAVTTPRIPFLTNPSDCAAGPLPTTLSYDSWEEPGLFRTVSFLSHDDAEPPNPIGVEGCERVPFTPTMTARPTSASADSPTGMKVEIHIPQEGLTNPVGLAQADLKDAVVTLPEGMSVNPSSANGLGSCSPFQVDLTGEGPAACPDTSKLGSVQIVSPLLSHPLPGAVYLARQRENKFGSLLALYIAINDPESGVVIKLPGRIETGPGGQVTASFDENPQLPFEDLNVEFFGGPRAALVTPPTCGTYTTTAQFTPWSGTPPVTSTSSFQITSGPNGSACPNGSFAPKLEAGTTNPVAGRYSPFVLNLSREGGTQQLSTIAATLPEGLLGKLAGIPYCPDAALGGIPSAEGTGAAQLANPSCPGASQLGTVSVGAGAGPSPFYVNTGKVYLAGPYKGAPLSLAIVTPALAGPFDLGNVVVRAALQVNPETTQITAVSDPLPMILQGIPLDLRSVAVNVSRDGFTLNPTSCEPMEVGSTITGTEGGVAHPSSHFQVASCEGLGFSPKLALNLKGATKRAKDPALKAVLTAPAGQANIGKVQVILPRSVFIDQSHVGSPCTRVQFAEGAGNGSACPPKSILGKATAYSPLLAEPLTGNVYFRSNGGERKLPDLVASLGGQIHVHLVGFIDSVHQKGKEGSRVRNTFASVPDAPVSRFVLELQGGKKGLLQNSTDLCRSTNKATVRMDGQNGKAHDFETVVRPACGSKKKSKPKKK